MRGKPPISDKTTNAMAVFAPSAKETNVSGLVLLYATAFDELSPAYPLGTRNLTIGRDPNANICIPDPSVSRLHARVQRRDKKWILRDLGGRNGTLVNGCPVDEAVLEDLDEVRVGNAIFKFVESQADEYSQYRLDGSEADPKFAAQAKARKDAGIVGGYRMAQAVALIQRAASSMVSVALFGETGVGKEVFARYLHSQSNRPGAFVAVNCAAIPQNLIESELFGFRKGAFSGAETSHAGLAKNADRGTLFLDEIGDLPLEAQAKLLRLLQTKEIRPLGGTAEHVDVRFTCATHRNLAQMVEENKFRADLFARINEFQVVLPPLRSRKEDIYCLTRSFLSAAGRTDISLSVPFMVALLHYDYPFNVRELGAFVRHALLLCDGPVLELSHLPGVIQDAMSDYGQAAQTGAAAPSPDEDELRASLLKFRGNVSMVAREYKRTRLQIHRWMKRYGIDVENYRSNPAGDQGPE